MILRFEAWLIDQQERADLVGNLARVLSQQEGSYKLPGRKIDEHKNWADVVVRTNQPGHIDAFNEAWQEFVLERQAAKESLE